MTSKRNLQLLIQVPLGSQLGFLLLCASRKYRNSNGIKVLFTPHHSTTSQLTNNPLDSATATPAPPSSPATTTAPRAPNPNRPRATPITTHLPPPSLRATQLLAHTLLVAVPALTALRRWASRMIVITTLGRRRRIKGASIVMRF